MHPTIQTKSSIGVGKISFTDNYINLRCLTVDKQKIINQTHFAILMLKVFFL